MKEEISNQPQRVYSSLRTIALLTLAFVLGAMFASTDHRVEAQFHQQTPRKAFLSGGARSELVLIEISHTAKRIEEQLIKIEKSIQQMEKP